MVERKIAKNNHSPLFFKRGAGGELKYQILTQPPTPSLNKEGEKLRVETEN